MKASLLLAVLVGIVACVAAHNRALVTFRAFWRWQWPPRGNLTVNLVDRDGNTYENVGHSHRIENFSWGRKWYGIHLPVDLKEVRQVGLSWRSIHGNRNTTARIYTNRVDILQRRGNKTEDNFDFENELFSVEDEPNFFADAAEDFAEAVEEFGVDDIPEVFGHHRRWRVAVFRNRCRRGIHAGRERLFNRTRRAENPEFVGVRLF